MGLRPGWQKKLMEGMMRRKALKLLMDTDWHDDIIEDNEDEDDCLEKADTLLTGKNSYYKYTTEYAVQHDFAMGVPLSGVWMSNGTRRIVLKNGKSLAIKMVQNTGRKVNGLWYHQWNLVSGVVECDKTSAVIPCIFLQEQTTDGGELELSEYTVIRKDWKMMGHNGNFERFGNI